MGEEPGIARAGGVGVPEETGDDVAEEEDHRRGVERLQPVVRGTSARCLLLRGDAARESRPAEANAAGPAPGDPLASRPPLGEDARMPLAVIPWFEFPTLELGPFRIQSFGVLSALGILAAVQLASRGSARLGKDPRVIPDFAVAGVLAGIVVGHLVHLFFYHPEELRDPLALLKIWEGLSSMGGLLGGIAAAVVFFRVRKIPFREHADAFALGVPPGWGVARVGCFTVHDHPGVRSDFFLAVEFPGGPRHDLGLYEAILLFAIGALVWGLHRRRVLSGRLLPLVGILYGAGRFLLDFLRTREVVAGAGFFAKPDGRQLGLTFAQWFSLALVAWAVWALVPRRGGGRKTG
jgi:phosphatidylglycerol:prolipoprotein diacylglycerol transferase